MTGRDEFRAICATDAANRPSAFAAESTARPSQFARRSRIIALWAALFSAGVLTACGPGNGMPNAIAESCLPSLPAPVRSQGPEAPGAFDVYADMSVSSTHFGRAQGATPYRDVMAFFLDEVGVRDDRQLFGFANAIAPATSDMLTRAARGEAGICGACGRTETRLDTLLDRLAADTDSPLSLVVTDLWLDNDDVLDTQSLSLSRPLRDIMGSGRAVGVFGIRAPYAQEVYDIPQATGTATLPRGSVSERPFFILAIGAPSEVMGFKAAIERDVLRDGAAEFAMFSPTPVGLETGESLATMEPFGANSPFGYGGSFVEGREDIPVLTLDRGAVGDLVFEEDKAPGSTGAQGLDILPGLDGGANFDVASKVWELEGPWADACDAGSELKSWMELDTYPRTYVANADGAAILYSGVQEDWLDLPRGMTLYMQYEVTAGGAQALGDASWLSQWSFSPERGPELLANPPQSFPVLNLEAFGNLLARAQADALTSPVVARGAALITAE
jgi:hypothetical protein